MRSYAKQGCGRAFLRLALLLCLEAGALPLLNHLGSLPFLATPSGGVAAWRLWLQTTPPEDAVASLLRLVATACAMWLLATTLLYLVARLGAIHRLGAALAWTVPGPVRRLIDGALTLSVLASLAGGGAALAATPRPPVPPPAVVVVTGPRGVLIPPGITPPSPPTRAPSPPPAVKVPTPLATTETSPAPAAFGVEIPPALPFPPAPEIALPSSPAPEAPARRGPSLAGAARPAPTAVETRPAPTAPAAAGFTPRRDRDIHVPAATAADSYPVKPGDNLWSIAAAEVSAQAGAPRRDLTNRQIARYWMSLLGLNRPSLRSGNANLIFPGEEISLPPLG
jgi:hypothetical protein